MSKKHLELTLDEEVIKAIRVAAVKKYGSLRSVSKLVEDLILHPVVPVAGTTTPPTTKNLHPMTKDEQRILALTDKLDEAEEECRRGVCNPGYVVWDRAVDILEIALLRCKSMDLFLKDIEDWYIDAATKVYPDQVEGVLAGRIGDVVFDFYQLIDKPEELKKCIEDKMVEVDNNVKRKYKDVDVTMKEKKKRATVSED